MKMAFKQLLILVCLTVPFRLFSQDAPAESTPADTLTGYQFPIRGTVYLDKNSNGTREASEPGMEGIPVSDGLEVVMTDANGKYLLSNSGKDAAFVFVHQPGNIRQSGQRFFQMLTDTDGNTTADFGLQAIPTDADTTSDIRFVQITDVHVRNSSDREFMQAAIDQIYQMDPLPDFIVATGDLVDWAVDEHYQNYVAGMGTPPMPYFNVFGNHELVFGPLERYHQYVGPDYYSFEQKGILFLALNCVTPSSRQEAWLARSLALLGKDRPVVVLQHFPPTVEELERFGEMGVRSVFSGHWHSEKEMEHAGVQSFNSPPFIMGGIDASPAGFKVVHMGPTGRARTEWRYGFQEQQLTIVSPQETSPVNKRGLPIIVNAYDSTHEIEEVTWELIREGKRTGSGALQRESAISWTGNVNRPPAGNYLLKVTVSDEAGNTWNDSREINLTGEVAAKPHPEGDWPMFMGDAGHHGEASPLHGVLPLRLAWSRDTGGDPDFASPVLAGGQLYLALKKRTADRMNGVAAFDPLTGKQLWQFETALAINHTPAYAAGTLCIAEMGGRIIGLDAATGREKWHHDLIDARGRYLYGAPAAYEGAFYAGAMRRMVRLEALTGQVEWEEQVGPLDNDWISSYGSPTLGDGYLLMSGMFFFGEAVAAVRAEDGSPVWRHQADNGLLSSAAIAGDRVFFCTLKSQLYALKLSDGKELWQQELGEEEGDGKWSSTTPAVKLTSENNGMVVAGSGDGAMYGLDLATGEVKWTHRSGTTVFKTSPYRRDDRPLLSSPTIAGEQVFFGSGDGHIYCLDLETGRELWSYQLGVPVLSTPLVSGNTLYAAASDGRLYAFTATIE